MLLVLRLERGASVDQAKTKTEAENRADEWTGQQQPGWSG